MFKIKRIYDPALPSDGYRILVDRLWPRGISKARAQINEWLREVAPTPDLIKWFGHQEENWPEFRNQYLKQLKQNSTQIKHLQSLADKHPVVTLLYGARDTQHNQAVVLLEYLNKQ